MEISFGFSIFREFFYCLASSFNFIYRYQVEFIITEMFNLYVKPTGIYTISSDLEKFAFVPGMGVKLNF